jgi:short-subunit dehydrogenase
LEAFSEIMAKDLAGTGVTVDVLVPDRVTNTGRFRSKPATIAPR